MRRIVKGDGIKLYPEVNPKKVSASSVKGNKKATAAMKRFVAKKKR